MESIPKPYQRPHIVDFAMLPEDVIEQVEINGKMALEVRDKNLKAWLNADFLLKHARLFGVGGVNINCGLTQKRPQPLSMRRGVVYRLIEGSEPFFDEYDVAYGMLGAKGTGVSIDGMRVYVSEIQKKKPEVIRESIAHNNNDPIGLFGYIHSRQEMMVSDMFADEGGRNGRVLGILLLNHNKLRDWNLKAFGNDAIYPLDVMLERMERNHDTAAICVRLMGADRYEDYECAKSTGIFTCERMLKRAAHTMSVELHKRGAANFIKHYGLTCGTELQQLLEDISRGQDSIYHQDKFRFGNLLKGLCDWNLGVYRRLSRKHFNDALTIFLDTQDICLAGFWYDWETSVPGSPGYMDYNQGPPKVPRDLAQV